MYAIFHADDVPSNVVEADNAVATQFPLGSLTDIGKLLKSLIPLVGGFRASLPFKGPVAWKPLQST
jgi:hypothetical protein